MKRNHKNYQGRTANVTDESTGLNLPSAFFAVESFNLYPNSLNFTFGDWVSLAAFDDGKAVFGLFRKFYTLLGTEFTDFQTSHKAFLTSLITKARFLSGAPASAEFRQATLNTITQKVQFQFYENGQFFTFEQDGAAYVSTVDGAGFAELKAAITTLCFGIAQARDAAFWIKSKAA